VTKALNFPDLADRVADDLYKDRLTISAAEEKLPLGNRAELRTGGRTMRN